jgi:hypothetical protein
MFLTTWHSLFPVQAAEKAAEKKGSKLGRIRLQVIDDCSFNNLEWFIAQNIDQTSTVITDGWCGYKPVQKKGYNHQRVLQTKTEDKSRVLPGINLVASLFKRLVLGTFHGHFIRIVEQVVVTRPITYSMIFKPVSVTQ